MLSATFTGESNMLGSSPGKFFRRKGVLILPGITALIRRSGRSSASPCVKFKTAAFALEVATTCAFATVRRFFERTHRYAVATRCAHVRTFLDGAVEHEYRRGRD